MSFMKPVLQLAAAVVSILVLVVGGLWGASEAALRLPVSKSKAERSTLAETADPQAVARGERLVALFGCRHCHGERLEGRQFLKKWDMRLSTPNLTRLEDRSAATLDNALRHGIDPKGRPLWYMPSGSFTHLTDGEVQDIVAYTASLPATGPVQPTARFGWKSRKKILQGEVKSSAQYAVLDRTVAPMFVGEHFAQGRELARACVECHGPDLTGGRVGKIPDLTIAAAYDLEDFERLLHEGVGAGGKKLGLMAIAAKTNFQVLSKAEIAQLHAYLRARADVVNGVTTPDGQAKGR